MAVGTASLLIGGVIDLAKRFIPDKEKHKELDIAAQKAIREFDSLLLTTSTTPWVDAFVKILYALERFINSLWRPLGTAAMTAFGLYAHYKGITIDTGIHAMLDGAFPGWGVSRHVHKKEELKRKRLKLPDIDITND